jgi:hypothetical protein
MGSLTEEHEASVADQIQQAIEISRRAGERLGRIPNLRDSLLEVDGWRSQVLVRVAAPALLPSGGQTGWEQSGNQAGAAMPKAGLATVSHGVAGSR